MRTPQPLLCPTARHACMLLCLLLFAVCQPAAAQDIGLPEDPLKQPDQWLTQDRWGELRYGLTVREPKDAIRVPDTPQGDVMRWALEDGTRISLSFARGVYEGIKNGKIVRMPAKIDLIKKQLGDEMKLATMGTVLNTRSDQVVTIGPLVGVINYFVVKPSGKNATPYLYGYALLQLDDNSVGVVRLEARPENMIDAVSTFECMVHSITVEPAKQVNRRINDWYVNAETLLESITQQDKLAAMHDDRLFRVLENGRDLGYARIWQRYQDKAFYEALKAKKKKDQSDDRLEGIDRFELEGNVVVVQSFFKGRGASLERLHEAIDDPDAPAGYWQIKNAMTYKNDPGNRRAGVWVETGVRGVAVIGGQRVDHLMLTREGTPPRHMVDFLLEREKDPSRRLRYPSADPRSYPSGDLKQLKFPTPPRAYLSFVDSHLIPAMLPNEEKTYAFSAYHPESSRIDIRLMRVEPGPNGGKTVYLRPVLDMSPQKIVFDRKNEIVSWSFNDGRELRKTTREELARIWKVTLRD